MVDQLAWGPYAGWKAVSSVPHHRRAQVGVPIWETAQILVKTFQGQLGLRQCQDGVDSERNLHSGS